MHLHHTKGGSQVWRGHQATSLSLSQGHMTCQSNSGTHEGVATKYFTVHYILVKGTLPKIRIGSDQLTAIGNRFFLIYLSGPSDLSGTICCLHRNRTILIGSDNRCPCNFINIIIRLSLAAESRNSSMVLFIMHVLTTLNYSDSCKIWTCLDPLHCKRPFVPVPNLTHSKKRSKVLMGGVKIIIGNGTMAISMNWHSY